MSDSEKHVQIVPPPTPDGQVRWSPVVGPETTRLMGASELDDAGRATVTAQSVDILARCSSPSEVSSRTGLVVGYVQSGKTLSFTTVVALARDNTFPLIILLAGTKEILHKQTSDRFAHDLEVNRDGGLSPWGLFENPVRGQASQVAQNITSMTGAGVPEKFRRATVITVMKNPSRLREVRELIEALPQHGVAVDARPVLVVDDEADQAGLNAAVQKDDQEATATYQAIVDLRAALKRHTYLMYTATPQAPLLINLADVLSPDFVTVLTPGAGYTGGEYFFERHAKTFVRRLSAAAAEASLAADVAAPPDDLQRALATYLLVLVQRGDGPVSMLVHPSHTTGLHQTYYKFVEALCASWKSILQTQGPDRDELLEDHFRPAYEDLTEGGASMRPLDELLGEVPYWIGATQIRKVNSGTPADSDINWKAAPSWILVGGNKLDRGFTVEGLAVTFMPRRLGAGQVDSVQQRARFFGYKKSYGLMCRAWLNDSTARAFEHYVEHEKLLRRELEQVDQDGISLKDWKRKMLLEPAYKPTRKAIIDLPYFHNRIRGDAWMSLLHVPPPGGVADNLKSVDHLVHQHAGAFEVVEGDPRPERRHTRALVSMDDILKMLADWQGHPDDQSIVNQMSLLLSARMDEDPALKVDVYRMDGGLERSRTPNGTNIVLPQGRSPKGDDGYPGDIKFFTDGVTSLQIHRVAIKGYDTNPVIGLSVRVPRSLAGAVLIQAE